jgi:hypothetical protein
MSTVKYQGISGRDYKVHHLEILMMWKPFMFTTEPGNFWGKALAPEVARGTKKIWGNNTNFATPRDRNWDS